MKNEYKASCTWGFAEDVQLLVKRGEETIGDYGLSQKEAEQLGKALLCAAEQVKFQEAQANDYFKLEDNKNE